jgi:hypothetical protein
MSEPKLAPCAIFIALAVSACMPLNQYHPPDPKTNRYQVCTMPSPGCRNSALQAYQDPHYLLGFIELDDQGLLFDRNQMDAVLDEIDDRAKEKDLLIVVFMHGWKHSAAPEDENIEDFRHVLARLSEAEAYISGASKGIPQPREVFGVYIGWRGESLTVPLLKNLTFWERKNTAHKVGHVGLTEVLLKLERVKEEAPGSGTRLAVIGHSFGGAAVYAALSQILEARFVRGLASPGAESPCRNAQVGGFGNLVVLINPAFEALLFTPMSDMSAECVSYSTAQLPVLAILTSEADDATRRAFPVGRWFSTFFEKATDDTTQRYNGTTGQQQVIDQNKANIIAVGHFAPYRTHELHAADARPNVFDVRNAWVEDQPGNKIEFKGSVLVRSDDSAGRNPYLIVRVDQEIIPDHNAIYDDRLQEFVKQLILISSKIPAQTEKAARLHPPRRSLLLDRINSQAWTKSWHRHGRHASDTSARAEPSRRVEAPAPRVRQSRATITVSCARKYRARHHSQR